MTTEISSSPERHGTTGIHRYFGHLADELPSGKVDYPRITTITIVLLGTLCGCEGWMEISEWADVRREWLATFLELGPEGQRIVSEALLLEMSRLRNAIGISYRTCTSCSVHSTSVRTQRTSRRFRVCTRPQTGCRVAPRSESLSDALPNTRAATATKHRRSILPLPRPACRCARGLYGP